MHTSAQGHARSGCLRTWEPSAPGSLIGSQIPSSPARAAVRDDAELHPPMRGIELLIKTLSRFPRALQTRYIAVDRRMDVSLPLLYRALKP